MKHDQSRLSRHLKSLGTGLACASIFLGATSHAQSFTRIPRPQLPVMPVPFQIVPAQPNLAWGNRSSYEITGPATSQLTLDGFGADGRVDVLGDDRPFTISEEFTNRSSAFVPSSYLYSLRIRQMIFRTTGNAIGWVPGPDATHTVHYQEQRGPGLRPGASFRTQYDSINPGLDFINRGGLECGMYEVEMTLDSDDAVDEGRFEFDNVTRHYIYLEGDQVFNVRLNQVLLSTLPAPVPPTTFATFDLIVPNGSTAEQLLFIGATHTRIVQPDAKVDTVPSPAPGAPVTFFMGAAPSRINDAITMRVADPTVNRPSEIFELERVTPETGLITVVSEDGCTIRQRSASVMVP